MMFLNMLIKFIKKVPLLGITMSGYALFTSPLKKMEDTFSEWSKLVLDFNFNIESHFAIYSFASLSLFQLNAHFSDRMNE